MEESTATGQSPSDATKTPDIADSMLPKPSGNWPFPTSATTGGDGAGDPATQSQGADTVDGAGAASEAPAEEHTPTRAEAVEMFKARPGLWSVLTTEGTITRDQC